MPDTSRIDLPPMVNRDKTFDAYTRSDWQLTLDWFYDRAVADLKLGRVVSETFTVFITRRGRPEIQQADLGFMHGTNRGAQRHVLMRAMQQIGAHAYGLISETWFIQTSNPKDLEKHEKVWGKMGEDPRRQEALVVAICTSNRLKLHRFGKIHRLTGEIGQGQVESVTPMGEDEQFKIGGAMLNLFEIIRGEDYDQELDALRRKAAGGSP